MLKKIHLNFIFIVIITCAARAQQPVVEGRYPKDFFRYPLDLPPATAGSFGELRPNHFHSGLDFRTNQRTGYPVHAVAEGYISRLRVQFGGFGNAVYITHPNGYTSVYGHLDHFSPELLQLIRQQQYAQHKYDVDFEVLPIQMPVYKGQVFAWSGNTGASGGPHLHFELRDSKTQETINAQLFGLTIPDKVPPVISGVSIYHLNGRPFTENTLRESFAVRGAAGNYHLVKPKIFELSGQTGFGISAIDMNSASPSRNGVYAIQLNVDGKTVYTFTIARFAFDQTHAINAYVDYPYYLKTGGFIQKCFVLPGSRITIYPQAINRGIVNFDDDALHDVEFVVRDISGNTSTLRLKVKSSIPKDKPVFHPQGTLIHYDQHTDFSKGNMKLAIEPGNLYEDIDLIVTTSARRPGSYSDIYHIANRYTPIHDTVNLWIKPDSSIGANINKAILFNAVTGSAAGGDADNGWIKAPIRTFGDYYVRIDTVPPVISPINIHEGSNMAAAKAIFLRMSDNLSGIKAFEGKVDGKWVLVERDYKSKILSYTFGPDIGSGKHVFEFKATDFKDNSSTFTAQFYR